MRPRWIAAAIAFLAAPCAAVAQTSPAPVAPAPPPPPPPPAPTVTATPTQAPTQAPTPSPAPAPSVAASPAPNPFPYVISPMPPPAGQPAIVQIGVSARVIHPGDAVLMRVLTTLDVTNVALEAYGLRFPLSPGGPGRFVLVSTVPSVPGPFLNRTYMLDCVGTTAAGKTVRIPFEMRVEPSP